MLQVRGADFDRAFVRAALVKLLDQDERIERWDAICERIERWDAICARVTPSGPQ